MHFSLYDLGTFSGFYYRELTKAHHFTGDTIIYCTYAYTYFRYVYVLILIPLEKVFKLSSYYLFNWFFIVYNISVIATIGMMVTKGTFQVLGKVFSRSIFGFAGIGHTGMLAGLLLLFS